DAGPAGGAGRAAARRRAVAAAGVVAAGGGVRAEGVVRAEVARVGRRARGGTPAAADDHPADAGEPFDVAAAAEVGERAGDVGRPAGPQARGDLCEVARGLPDRAAGPVPRLPGARRRLVRARAGADGFGGRATDVAAGGDRRSAEAPGQAGQ